MTRAILIVPVTLLALGCGSYANRNGFAGDTRRTSDIQFSKQADQRVDGAGRPGTTTQPAALRPWDARLMTPDDYDRAVAADRPAPTPDASAGPNP